MLASHIRSLMDFHGETATLTRTTAASRSSLDRTNTTSDFMVKVAMRFDNPRSLAESMVLEGQRTCYMAAEGLATVPHENDKLTLSNGEVFNVVSVDRRTHAGDTIAYILRIQGGSHQ